MRGRKGNKGKSWLQSYIQSLYGIHRVARFDITNETQVFIDSWRAKDVGSKYFSTIIINSMEDFFKKAPIRF